MNTRTDLIRILEYFEHIQQLHVGLRRFDRDHVGIHCSDRFELSSLELVMTRHSRGSGSPPVTVALN